MTVGDWAQIAAGSAGALAAILVALFGRRLVRPRLVLTIEDFAGYRKAPPDIWYHLRVTNRRRWSPATRVRVFVLKIDVRGRPDRSWAGEVAIRWRFQDQTGEYRDFGPPYDCDLCAVGADNRLRLQPMIDWQLPGDLLTHAPPVHLNLTFQARGFEADSAPLHLTLDWEDGKDLKLGAATGRR